MSLYQSEEIGAGWWRGALPPEARIPVSGPADGGGAGVRKEHPCPGGSKGGSPGAMDVL